MNYYRFKSQFNENFHEWIVRLFDDALGLEKNLTYSSSSENLLISHFFTFCNLELLIAYDI